MVVILSGCWFAVLHCQAAQFVVVYCQDAGLWL